MKKNGPPTPRLRRINKRDMNKKYNHKMIEGKWREKWEKDKLYQADLDKAKKPFYNLMMFPYPSAEGLHVGNMYAFVHSDAYGRFMRLRGFDVFEPIGLDGFGIHSENYAIKIGEHIKDVSARTEKHFYNQLHIIGNGYDWSRTVETYKPNYYKWTQWLFLKMYEKGLAYRKKSSVNWCPSCKTVLSDEQVIAGKCERCDSETEKKQMEQWFWRITDYAEKLLKNLDVMDWSEEVKTIQMNWIGKSEGVVVKFKVKSYKVHKVEEELKVFTTRPDTLFGCTYMVVCPEHKLITNYKLSPLQRDYAHNKYNKVAGQITNYKGVYKYCEQSKKKSDLERTDLAKEKTGVKIEGLIAVNPVNNEEIPIFVADYVLAGYGTGAIMAVPAHDERDFEFAKKYNLPIRQVVAAADSRRQIADGSTKLENCFTEQGINVNSDFLDGLETKEAKEKIIRWIEEKGAGKREVVYKLRDWCVSRQRYWGPPIPMVCCEKCGWVPISEKDLPVLLPEMDDFLPDGSGKGPLNKIKEFVNTTCPKCGGPAKRETDVSDPFVDSCWYYMRYLCAEFDDRALDKERLKKWMPVDMYIGGKEHAVLHLLYSRFVNMVMRELGYAPSEEPFKCFRAHGLLIRDGAKMSKSKGNVVNPDEYIEKFGADAVRMYLMFLGDMRQGGDWRDSGMNGMYRFVNRVWNLVNEVTHKATGRPKCLKNTHKTIKKVTEDLENLKFNTAIAAIMEYVNYLQAAAKEKNTVNKEVVEILVKLLAPFAPFMAEELWSSFAEASEDKQEKKKYEKSIFLQSWPKYDPELIKDETIKLVIQINGKLRDTVEVSADISEEEAKNIALTSGKIKKWIAEKEIVKVIFVKGKLVNIAVK